MRAARRLSLATIGLAVVWAASFTTSRLPFLPTVPIAAVTVLLAGVWVRRSPDLDVPPVRATSSAAGAGLVIAALQYGVGLALFAVVSQIVPELTTSAAAIVGRTRGLPLAIALLVAAVLTAPAEELFWRGAVHPFVTRRLSNATARVLVSGGAYTAFHVVTLQPALIAAAALAGLVWAWTIERHGLFAAIVAHATWTALMLLGPPV